MIQPLSGMEPIMIGAARAKRKVAQRHATRGATMLEVLFALSIVAFLSLGALALYSQATSVNRVNKTVSQVVLAVTATRTLFQGQSNYGTTSWGSIHDKLASGRLVPKDMIRGQNNLYHAFGGQIFVHGMPPGDPWMAVVDAPTMIVTLQNVPAKFCVALVSALSMKPGADAPLMGYLDNASGNVYYLANPAPQSPAQAKIMCNNTSGDLQLQWRFL